MFVDLRLDTADRRIQIFNAALAVATNLVLNTGVDALLLQISSVDDPTARRNAAYEF